MGLQDGTLVSSLSLAVVRYMHTGTVGDLFIIYLLFKKNQSFFGFSFFIRGGVRVLALAFFGFGFFFFFVLSPFSSLRTESSLTRYCTVQYISTASSARTASIGTVQYLMYSTVPTLGT